MSLSDTELDLVAVTGQLAEAYLTERVAALATITDQRKRVRVLERKILGQRKALRNLHESHDWELGTKLLLVDTLTRIAESDITVTGSTLRLVASHCLEEVAKRDGPRTSEPHDGFGAPVDNGSSGAAPAALDRLSAQFLGR